MNEQRKQNPLVLQNCVACNANMKYDLKMRRYFQFPVELDYSPDIIQCRSCGLRRLFPSLTDSQYGGLYDKIYFNNASRISAYDDYRSSFEDRVRVYDRKIKRLKQYYPEAKNILDIGAGEGDFLNICRGQYEIYGLELSPRGKEQAKARYQIDLIAGSSMDIERFNRTFDIIHMHHVFEHLLDPVEFLGKLKTVMHRDSLFIFEVPYQFDSINEILRRWVGMPAILRDVNAVHHPFFYTPKSLGILMDRYGYEVIRLFCPPPERVRLLGDSLFKKLTRPFLYFVQKILKRGSSIEVICRLKREVGRD